MFSVGIDLGGTKRFFAVVDEKGNIHDDQRIPTPGTWEEMKNSIITIVSEYQKNYEISALGFGVPGLIGLDGYAYYSPNFTALNKGVAVHEELAQVLNVPVFIDNDNNCVGYAEAHFGAAKNARVIATVGLGTGIGGSLVIDGVVFRGAHGFAGDFGHMTIDIGGPLCACGKHGCYEAFASGTALGRIGRQYASRGEADAVIAQAGGSIDAIDGYHVGQAAIDGDGQALAIMDEYAHNVARGLSSLTESLDPEVFVISGGVVELGDVLFTPLSKHYRDEIQGDATRPAPRILPAFFGEKAGVIGAGTMALSKLH